MIEIDEDRLPDPPADVDGAPWPVIESGVDPILAVALPLILLVAFAAHYLCPGC